MANRVINYKVTANPDVVTSIDDDGIVIFHTVTGRLFRSNGTGAFIWRCIEEQLPLEAIAQRISSNYSTEIAAAQEHTARFLAELERHDLIERGDKR